MKRLIASAFSVLFCVSLFAVMALATTEAPITVSTYPPPPPGYIGIWPPPDVDYTCSGDTTPEPVDTMQEGVDPWTDPNE